jgi:hypothetical protein
MNIDVKAVAATEMVRLTALERNPSGAVLTAFFEWSPLEATARDVPASSRAERQARRALLAHELTPEVRELLIRLATHDGIQNPDEDVRLLSRILVRCFKEDVTAHRALRRPRAYFLDAGSGVAIALWFDETYADYAGWMRAGRSP